MITNIASRFLSCSALCAAALLTDAQSVQAQAFRPPSVPLVSCDPYFSVWSPSDNLTDGNTTHWTGKPHRLESLVTIDGNNFRVMGSEPAAAPALRQTGLDVLPTRTIYTFEGSGVGLTLTFTTPALPEDIDILSRPVTYVTYEFRATDGTSHKVSLEFSASGELAVNEGKQQVTASLVNIGRGGQELVIVGQLRQVADALAGDGFAHIHAEKVSGAAGGIDEAEQHIHRGGLPSAVGAEKAKHFAGTNAQVQVVDGHFLRLPRALRPKLNPQVLGFNNRFHGLLEHLCLIQVYSAPGAKQTFSGLSNSLAAAKV